MNSKAYCNKNNTQVRQIQSSQSAFGCIFYQNSSYALVCLHIFYCAREYFILNVVNRNSLLFVSGKMQLKVCFFLA